MGYVFGVHPSLRKGKPPLLEICWECCWKSRFAICSRLFLSLAIGDARPRDVPARLGARDHIAAQRGIQVAVLAVIREIREFGLTVAGARHNRVVAFSQAAMAARMFQTSFGTPATRATCSYTSR